jgi:hypothetical protein
MNVLSARREKVYVDDRPDGWFEGNGECTREQSKLIDRSINYVMPIMEYSVENRNDDLWEKWFGANSR